VLLLFNVKTKQNFLSQWKGALLVLLFCLCPLQVALADDWNLKSMDGAHYKLSEQKDKWVLVNFWAPWCPTCLAEIPALDALQKEHKDLLVIGIAVQYGKIQEVTDALRTLSVNYPIVLGNEDIASDFGGMNGMPTSFLYAPTGKLVGQHEGPLTQEEIEQVMAKKSGSEKIFTR
jgi:thiol-disulfide isomerase/thioredoxin